MVRLSSQDASMLMDVLEQHDLPPEERRELVIGAKADVRKIAEALIYPDQIIDDPDIKEAVESIRRWADETKKIEEKQRLYA